jgi:hypothetical protein
LEELLLVATASQYTSRRGMQKVMHRLLLVAAASLVACGSPAAPPAPSALDVQGDFASPGTAPPNLSFASAQLHLVDIHAVSDRSSSDPRTRVAALDLPLAGAASATLPSVPPALYSGLRFTLGDALTAGLDLMGAFGKTRLHVLLAGASVYVSCADPLPLDPGGAVQLQLHADMSHWFDGVDLASAAADSDDNGLIVSADDNATLAARIEANLEASFRLDCAPR